MKSSGIQGVVLAAMLFCGTLVYGQSSNAIPYQETFEGMPAGGSILVAGNTNGWYSGTNITGAFVTNISYTWPNLLHPVESATHTQALNIADIGLTNRFKTYAPTNVTVDFVVQAARSETVPFASLMPGRQSAFYFDAEGHLAVWCGIDTTGTNNTWLTYSNTPVGTSDWARITIRFDYTTDALRRCFKVTLNGVELLPPANGYSKGVGAFTADPGGTWLLTANQTSTQIESFALSGPGMLDDLVVTTADVTNFFSQAEQPRALTVNSGSGSGLYTNGQQVAISADAIPGKTFVQWIGDTQYVASVSSSNTTVTMSTNDVILTATYVDITYALTVTSGTGGGSYTNGQQVGITANAPAGGYTFNQWTGDTQYVASVSSSNTTVTMPSQAVTLTATYSAQAGVIYSNGFSSQATGWFTFANTTLTQTNGILKMTSPAGGLQRGAEYNFGTNNLAVGDKLSVKFDVYLDIISNANGVVRWELLNSAGTKLTANTINGITSTNYNPRVGYIALMDSRTSGGTGTATIRQDTVTNTMMSINGPSLGNLTGLNVFTSRWDTVVWSIERTAANTYVNSMSVNGDPVLSVTDTGGLTNAFDTFVIGASVSDAANYSIDNVQVSVLQAGQSYALTVNSGSGSGSYTNGQQVAITASNLTGKTFDHWIGDTQLVNNVTYTNALVTMSTNAATLTATYVDVYYALTVNNGTGGGSYTNGRQVAISANAPAGGYAFDKWTGNTQFVASASSASTTVTMPAQAVALTATYIATEQYTTNAIPVPYSWLAGYGITNNQDAAVLLDPDGDGLTTEQEYIAGTVPTNAASVLRAAQATRNVITWTAQSNRTYSVYWSTNLVKGFALKQDNIMYPTNNFTNSTPDARINHYQIKVRMQ